MNLAPLIPVISKILHKMPIRAIAHRMLLYEKEAAARWGRCLFVRDE